MNNQSGTDGYTPGEVQKIKGGLPDFYRFSLKQLRFLEEYAKHLDVNRAAREVETAVKTVRGNWLTQEKFQAEIEAIHKIWQTNIRMTAEHATARHIELMDKVETEFDNAEGAADKAKLAAPLAKMSDSYLKAAGKFATGGDQKGISVTINIDLGGEDQPVVIEGEVINDENK